MRGHCRNVRSQSDVTTGASGHGAFRGYINHRRHGRGIKVRDDVIHGNHQTARGIQLDDEAFVVLAGGDVERAGDVVGGGRADGTVNFYQPHLRGLQHECLCRGKKNQGDEDPTLHIGLMEDASK